jgi:hypothetical protein
MEQIFGRKRLRGYFLCVVEHPRWKNWNRNEIRSISRGVIDQLPISETSYWPFNILPNMPANLFRLDDAEIESRYVHLPA